jgi:hypothetical protein
MFPYSNVHVCDQCQQVLLISHYKTYRQIHCVMYLLPPILSQIVFTISYLCDSATYIWYSCTHNSLNVFVQILLWQ